MYQNSVSCTNTPRTAETKLAFSTVLPSVSAIIPEWNKEEERRRRIRSKNTNQGVESLRLVTKIIDNEVREIRIGYIPLNIIIPSSPEKIERRAQIKERINDKRNERIHFPLFLLRKNEYDTNDKTEGEIAKARGMPNG